MLPKSAHSCSGESEVCGWEREQDPTAPAAATHSRSGRTCAQQSSPPKQVKHLPSIQRPRDGAEEHGQGWVLGALAGRPQKAEKASLSKPTKVQCGSDLLVQTHPLPLSGKGPSPLSHRRALSRKKQPVQNSGLKITQPTQPEPSELWPGSICSLPKGKPQGTRGPRHRAQDSSG